MAGHPRQPLPAQVLPALQGPAWDGPERASPPALSLPSGMALQRCGQSPMIMLSPVTGVFQRHHGEYCAGLSHERSHVPGVRALAAGHQRRLPGDQPLSARSVAPPRA